MADRAAGRGVGRLKIGSTSAVKDGAAAVVTYSAASPVTDPPRPSDTTTNKSNEVPEVTAGAVHVVEAA